MPEGWARSRAFPRWLARVAACLIAWGAGSLPAADNGCVLRDFSWNQSIEPLEFRVLFSEPPTLRVHDELTLKRFFYLDFFGAAGPAEPASWDVDTPYLFHVKRIYYPDRQALRLVFYARQDVRFTVQTRGGREYAVRVHPIQFADLPENRKEAAGARKLVVLDPGHGCRPGDPVQSMGASTARRSGGRIRYEKELVLEIGKRLARLLKKAPNLDAYLTREDDRYISLPERIELADKAQGDLFLSIHLNAAGTRINRNARGFEIYYLSSGAKETDRTLEALENDVGLDLKQEISTHEDMREILRSLSNDKLLERQTQSQQLCQIIDGEFARLGPFRQYHRGVKSAAFRVLMNYNMPAALVECGFIDHPVEGRLLTQSEIQDRIAALLFNGINRYFAKVDPTFEPHLVRVDP